MSVEELNELHRKEKKELQVKIQTLKKSVTKGDKKKKKEIDAEIEKLEKDFEIKCKLELEKLEESKSTSVIDSNTVSSQVDNESGQESQQTKQVKVSKAQKRKEKKVKHEIERENEIALQEIENQKGPAALELKSIERKLAQKGLRVKDVKSDGNCMYYAISDQLAKQKSIDREWRQLRQETCDYMLANPDQFQPYMTSDDGDLLDVDKYQEYCEKVRDTLVWGGQLELKALADIFNVLIEVVQGEGSEIVIGENGSSSKLIITYHRHMFGSGEHYNSTEPLPPPQQDE